MDLDLWWLLLQVWLSEVSWIPAWHKSVALPLLINFFSLGTISSVSTILNFILYLDFENLIHHIYIDNECYWLKIVVLFQRVHIISILPSVFQERIQYHAKFQQNLNIVFLLECIYHCELYKLYFEDKIYNLELISKENTQF